MADILFDAETIGVLVNQSKSPDDAKASFFSLQGISIAMDLAKRIFEEALVKKFPLDEVPVAASFLVRSLK